MCLVAFQKMFRKIFSDVWLCSWKYYRKHIFYLLLTFSQIFLVTKRIYNIIYSSKHKQNPEKNNQIRTNEGKIVISERSRDRVMRRSRSTLIGASRNRRGAGAIVISSLFLPLSLSLSLFYFPRPEVIWSENRNGNSFPAFWLWNSVYWKCSSVWPNLK